MLVLADLSTIVDQAWVWFVAPVGAILALLAALLFSRAVMSHSEGEPEMIEIARAVRTGAMAYLKRQYRVVAMVFFVLLVTFGVYRLLDWRYALLALVALVFCHREPGAPFLVWLSLLGAMAVRRAVPEGRLASLARIW